MVLFVEMCPLAVNTGSTKDTEVKYRLHVLGALCGFFCGAGSVADFVGPLVGLGRGLFEKVGSHLLSFVR